MGSDVAAARGGQLHPRPRHRPRQDGIPGEGERADYILYYKPNIPLAVIEAKDNDCAVGDGLQQAIEYADTLKLPFVFSSNGDGFVFHDGTRTCARRSPRQRRRGFRLARDSRVLLVGDTNRHDRHPEGNEVRLEHRLLRETACDTSVGVLRPGILRTEAAMSDRGLSLATISSTSRLLLCRAESSTSRWFCSERSGTPRPVSAAVALALHRTALEALTNVRRHAAATHVDSCGCRDRRVQQGNCRPAVPGRRHGQESRHEHPHQARCAGSHPSGAAGARAGADVDGRIADC